ncbi:MAG: hypothetical protein ACM31C_14550 [Acidobacteriota bacterium]
MSKLFTVLALVLGLGTAARAETVDWSQYIDKNPSQPIASSSRARPMAVAKTSKSAKATKTSRAKPKARAKTKARRK